MSDCGCGIEPDQQVERRTLLALLAINGVMFFAEAILGWLSDSAALIADSLDMLADASVYAAALYAVGRSLLIQARIARFSGYIEIMLGLGVLFEVLRRFFMGSEPLSLFMMGVGAVALLANISCLLLLHKHRNGGVHMRASWIFSANDVIANLGVILSGLLVMLLDSRYPDLLIGAIISLIVIRGGLRILKEAKASTNSQQH